MKTYLCEFGCGFASTDPEETFAHQVSGECRRREPAPMPEWRRRLAAGEFRRKDISRVAA